MYEQYVTAYKHHSVKYGADTAIFYMVGKFYEMYDWVNPKTGETQTSMKRAVEHLGIQLSIRDGAGPKGTTGHFAGIPEQSVHKFATILTKANRTVVIIDQVKDAKGAITERTPSRILSPGTHVEAATTDAVYIAAIWLEESSWSRQEAPKFGLVALDLTTGRITTYDGSATGKASAWTADDASHFFQVHSPREWIVWWKGDAPSIPATETVRRQFGLLGSKIHVERYSAGGLDHQLVREDFLRRAISVKSLLPLREALQIQGTPLVERGLCALLQRLEEMYPSGVKALHSPESWIPEKSLFLGNQALLQLNMIPSRGEASVLGLFEKALTPFGRRAIRNRLLYPLADAAELEKRYDQIDTVNGLGKAELERMVISLRSIGDLPRIHRRIHGGDTTAADVLVLDQSYRAVQSLSSQFAGGPLAQKDWERRMGTALGALEAAFSVEKARRASEDLFCFREGRVPSVDSLESEIAGIHSKFGEIKRTVEEWGGIPEGNLNLEFREMLGPQISGGKAVMNSLEGKSRSKFPFPGFQFNSKKSGATLEIPEMNSLFQRLQGKRLELQREIRRTLPAVCGEFVAAAGEALEVIEEWVANIDVTHTIWKVSKENGYVRPELAKDAPSSFLDLKGLRHPLIESTVSRIEYVTHDVLLDPASCGWLVYGMNASGKSSLIKAVGIAVILGQAGCFVPAKSMRIAPFKSLFTRILNMDNLWAGLSSFAVEMTELREILQRATESSLVLGDELCSGTESVSATALVGAGLQWLHGRGVKFIFATHLHGLLDIRGLPPLKIWHLKVRYEGATDRLIYERTLTPGPGSSLYGLEVARAMNLPDEVLAQAGAIRRQLLGTANESEAPMSQWNGGIQRRECEVCSKGITKELEVHHIRGRAEAVEGKFADGTDQNSARNLIVVCAECHDKHHAGLLLIAPLKQTSEGPSRDVAVLSEHRPRSKKWSEDQVLTIEKYLREYPTCPPKRLVYDLMENEGIQISEASLRGFRKSLN